MSHAEVSSDLVPEGDLPGVPARDPRGEQPFHVAQEHHPVHPVVLTAGLLMEAETKGNLTHMDTFPTVGGGGVMLGDP